MGELVGERITQLMGEPLGEFLRELLTQLMGECMGELLGELITQCFPQCLGERFTRLSGEESISDRFGSAFSVLPSAF